LHQLAFNFLRRCVFSARTDCALKFRPEPITVIIRAREQFGRTGPLPREVSGLAYPDATNVPNAWQGNLRFAALDLDLLAKSIGDDQPIAGVAVEERNPPGHASIKSGTS